MNFHDFIVLGRFCQKTFSKIQVLLKIGQTPDTIYMKIHILYICGYFGYLALLWLPSEVIDNKSNR